MTMRAPPWWQRAVIYEIYPRSFQDSDGDGVGDLKGMIERVDYLSWLGVDAVWICPIYPSPMADFGYDVADYVGIEPLFGTLDDFDRLVAALHERGIRLILDFVPNHSSDQHPGSRRRARRATVRGATGTSGAIRRRAAGHPTTGSARPAAGPGSSTGRAGNIITTPFSPPSPTSTGAIPP